MPPTPLFTLQTAILNIITCHIDVNWSCCKIGAATHARHEVFVVYYFEYLEYDWKVSSINYL